MGSLNAGRCAILVTLVAIAIASSRAKNPAPPASIPAGVQINVRVADKLSSNKSKTGDLFHGTLEAPIESNGQVLAPKKAEVMGYVARAHASSRADDPGVLELALMSVKMGDNYVPLNATRVMKGETHSKHDAPPAAGKVVLVSAPGTGETVVESKAVLTWVTSPAGSQDWTSNRPKDVHAGSGTPFRILGHDEDKPDEAQPEAKTETAAARYSFSAADRRLLRQCLSANHAAPAGVATPAVLRQLQRNQPLPAAVEKRAQTLPPACSAKLPKLPANWKLVSVGGRVVLLDASAKVADLFVIMPPAQHTAQVRRVSAAR